MRLAALAVLLASSSASADSNHDRKAVLIGDGICDGLAVSAAIPKLPEDLVTLMLWGGILGQAVVAPAIHAANGDYGRAGISLGSRVAAPVLGFFAGTAICEKVTPHRKTDFLRCLGGGFLGGVIGILAAQATDWLVLSRSTEIEMKPTTGFVFRF